MVLWAAFFVKLFLSSHMRLQTICNKDEMGIRVQEGNLVHVHEGVPQLTAEA